MAKVGDKLHVKTWTYGDARVQLLKHVSGAEWKAKILTGAGKGKTLSVAATPPKGVKKKPRKKAKKKVAKKRKKKKAKKKAKKVTKKKAKKKVAPKRKKAKKKAKKKVTKKAAPERRKARADIGLTAKEEEFYREKLDSVSGYRRVKAPRAWMAAWDPWKGQWTDSSAISRPAGRGRRVPPGSWPPDLKPEEVWRRKKWLREEKVVYCLPASRFGSGLWAPQGDIRSSYAVDKFEIGKVTTVKPFEHDGKLWIGTSSLSRGPWTFEITAHELVPRRKWKAKARKYQMGAGYKGTLVQSRGQQYVMGKPALFVPDNAPVC